MDCFGVITGIDMNKMGEDLQKEKEFDKDHAKKKEEEIRK